MQKHALQNPATPWLYREAPQKDFSSETNFKHFCTCPRSPSSPMMRSQVALFTDIFVTRREMSLKRSDSQIGYFVNPCYSNCLWTGAGGLLRAKSSKTGSLPVRAHNLGVEAVWVEATVHSLGTRFTKHRVRVPEEWRRFRLRLRFGFRTALHHRPQQQKH